MIPIKNRSSLGRRKLTLHELSFTEEQWILYLPENCILLIFFFFFWKGYLHDTAYPSALLSTIHFDGYHFRFEETSETLVESSKGIPITLSYRLWIVEVLYKYAALFITQLLLCFLWYKIALLDSNDYKLIN